MPKWVSFDFLFPFLPEENSEYLNFRSFSPGGDPRLLIIPGNPPFSRDPRPLILLPSLHLPSPSLILLPIHPLHPPPCISFLQPGQGPTEIPSSSLPLPPPPHIPFVQPGQRAPETGTEQSAPDHPSKQTQAPVPSKPSTQTPTGRVRRG
jgi:hypothetical protein